MVSMASDLALTVKDVLRGIRFAARVQARQFDKQQAALEALVLGGAAQARAGRIYDLAGTLARPVGKVAERICDGGPAPVPEDEFLLPISQSLGALAANDGDMRLAASLYRCASHCLDRLGVHNVQMSEQSIVRAARPLAVRHRAALKSADVDRRLHIVADVTRALVAAQPVKRAERGDQAADTAALADLNEHCFLAAGLATAVASVPGLPPGTRASDVLESAELAVAARHDRLSAALKQPDAATALAREFAAIVPFLP